ncbi:hypothetical protein LCGC14_1663350 [marine sediment metagenome]|uniref:Uncharacterized protein n=1 Tax=marine sediment metagenome TaxID=412755 RepID=A0A0F9KTG9_9ZZZZ
MPHRKNTRTGKALPHDEEEKKKIAKVLKVSVDTIEWGEN